MNKFFTWFEANRRPIGYAIGGLNALAALNYLMMGSLALALLWAVISAMLFYDTYKFRQ